MPPCCKYNLGTARWWVRASRLTGGTQERIRMPIMRSAKIPVSRRYTTERFFTESVSLFGPLVVFMKQAEGVVNSIILFI